MTEPALPLPAEPPPPSAARVSGPITPSATSPRAAWKRWTAACVSGPKSPSAATPSAACAAATAGPWLPSRRSVLAMPAVVSCALARSAAGTTISVVSSAAETARTGRAVRRSAWARRRRERASERSQRS